MLDTSSAIRDRIVATLNGNLTYNGQNVPVYAEARVGTNPKNYVIVGTIEESVEYNNNKFFTIADVNVEILCEQYKRSDMSQVDNISSQILTLLLPTPSGINIGDANFDIYPIGRRAIRYLSLENGQNFIARKIITIRNLVNQK